MRVPLSWLEEFVELPGLSAQEIVQELSLKSVEATVYEFGINLKDVFFGKILEIKPLSTKASLAVVKVDIGKGYNLQVVTSDRSLETGDVVAVAPPGAEVGDIKVHKKDFGGVTSEGMLLSPQELGLEDVSEGVLKLKEDIEPGTEAGKLLGFGEEIIELDITPNRGDVLSVKGLARELSAIFRLKKKERKIERFAEKGELAIKLEDPDCHRYRGVIIEGLKVLPSPLWIKRRLWQAGIRSINNIVDVTNYILLQEGQPLHAFDLGKIQGKVSVRPSREGESITTLDGEHKILPNGTLVIADEEKPIAVAGVIGGLESGVTTSTKDILLEAAYFVPQRVRSSSRSLGVRTESSYRFERNVDIESLDLAQDIAIRLILDLAGGSVKAIRDEYPRPYEPKRVFLSTGRYMRYAGNSYKKEDVSEILNALELPHDIKRCGIEVFVPAHRSFDISRDVDIIEELMRIKGYENFPSQELNLSAKGLLWKDDLLEVKKFLRGRGLSEVISISFEDTAIYELLDIEKPQVEILNPLVPSQRFMRSSLLPSLLRVAQFNDNHYNHNIAIFELGKVFLTEGEEYRLGVLLKGSKKPYPREDWNAYELSEILQGLVRLFGKQCSLENSDRGFLHPHIQAKIKLGNKDIGFFGKLHPKLADRLELKGDVFVAELKLGQLLEAEGKIYLPISKYPPVIRDLALVVDKTLSVSKLINEIKSQLEGNLEDVAVFDVYSGTKVGEGKKSVGVRLIFRSLDRSLTGEEVNSLVEDLVRRLRERFGAEIR